MVVKEEGIEEGSFHFCESCKIAHGLVTAVCSVVWEGGWGGGWADSKGYR